MLDVKQKNKKYNLVKTTESILNAMNFMSVLVNSSNSKEEKIVYKYIGNELKNLANMLCDIASDEESVIIDEETLDLKNKILEKMKKENNNVTPVNKFIPDQEIIKYISDIQKEVREDKQNG